ncbi:hypothetical protein [Saccharicrinis sp. 156]|uniref:hypothetical protein n=1 Tax=Saccharicrinis sp. 156 TaxID=3417574 RepID=UPI003D347D98
MNKLSNFILKGLRRVYLKINKKEIGHLPEHDSDADSIAQKIYGLLSQDKPCMIARFGAFELATITNYLGVRQGRQSLYKYIKGDVIDWWWNKTLLNFMHQNAGFFPMSERYIEKFCQLMLEETKNVDILGSWQKNEFFIQKELNEASKIQLIYLDPYWSKKPWTRILEGKKVLVVHPFKHTIEAQYKRRELLFENPAVLPKFLSLQVIRAVQSIGGSDNGFKDWFEALNYMKSEIDKCDYDICLIGCGAYGFPLAAHVKRMGKKAVHLGGSLQLLFGIKGKRWEHPEFGIEDFNEKGKYLTLMNEYWIYPGAQERPKSAGKVEDACYW